ncbi:hypothetical protein GYA19_04455 [Candidatus Beckwithbacteria bacterium]|nr:hypothetical protein [Candidatus Beckwithbacteria bacterium]
MATTKKTQTETKQTFPTKLSWLPKKTFELEITIPQEEVAKTYQQVLKETAAKTTVKGFRQGKAPLDLVEKQLDKTHLYEHVANHLIPDSYDFAIDHHNLHPIVTPKIDLVSADLNKDWIVKATACEGPEVKLNNYKDKIKGIKAKNAIWTPEKAKKSEKETKEVDINQIFEELLKTAEVEIADLLIERETNRMLSQLIDQVNAMGMTVSQYAQAQGKTEKQIRDNYEKSATDGLKLEFILNQIAVEEKLTVNEQEIDEFIKKAAEPGKPVPPQNAQQKVYLGIILKKQKTIDFLKVL